MRPRYGSLARERQGSARAERITYTMMMAALFMLGTLAVWQSMAPVQLDMPAEAPALSVTSTAGPPVTVPGHHAHPHTP